MTRTNTILARLIRLVTHDTYSHSSISFNKKCNHMISFSRKYVYFPFIGIFNKEDIRKGLFNEKNTKMVIYEIKVTNKQYSNIRKTIKKIEVNNEGYNIIGLILAIFKIKLHRNKYYCSEFLYEVLSNENVGIIDKKDNVFKPEQLVNEYFNKIYEGRIIDYNYL